MARFVFSLSRVLKHKERCEQAAELLRHQAQASLLVCETELAALHGKLDGIANAMAKSFVGMTNLTTWLAGRQQMEYLGKQIALAQARVVDAGQRLRVAIANHQQAARGAEGIRQLEKRRRESHREQAASKEQVDLDDINIRRWTVPQTASGDVEERMP